MISKKDAVHYLDKMDKIEKKMEVNYREMASNIEHEEIKNMLLTMTAEENAHDKLVTKLKNFLEEVWKE